MLVVHAEFRLEKLKGRCQFEDVIMGGRFVIILQLFLEEWGRRVWSRFIWLGICISNGVFWTQ